MSLLSRNQRAVIRADTMVDQLVLDRVVDAFDALIDRGDVGAYKTYMGTAIAQMGYEGPIPQDERPTAVDKIKTICIRAYADRERITFQQARARLVRMLEG